MHREKERFDFTLQNKGRKDKLYVKTKVVTI